MAKKKGAAWNFFNSNRKGKGVACKYCPKVFTHPNVNKMENHIIKCIKCPAELKKCFKKKKDISDKSTDSPVPVPVSWPATASTSTQLSEISDNSTRSSSRNLMEHFMDHMTPNENESLNQAISKAIIISGAPLSMVEHPLWQKFFEQIRPSYTLPSRNRISTTYLDAQFAEMQQNLKEMLDNAKNLHLQCDGWSNIRNESIIDFVIAKPEPLFVDYVVTKEQKHDAAYLCTQMQKAIEKYDVNKFFVVIGDNAANMRAAFKLLKQKYDHLVPLGCIAHLLHLLCNDILNCCSAKKIISNATNVVKTIRNSHRLQALFRRIGKEKNINISLKLAGKTRWGSNLFCLKSLFQNKIVLQTLAVSDQDVVTQELKNKLLDDTVFWMKIEKMINILEPIISLLTRLESDQPLIHIVYTELENLETNLQELLPLLYLPKTEESAVLKKLSDRKSFALGSIHLAATLLDPSCLGSNLKPDEIIDAMEFICNVGKSMGMGSPINKVRTDLTNYRDKEGIWSKPFIWEAVEETSPLIWWKGLRGTNTLAPIAVRILSAPITSAATERTFSTFSWIHSKKRNRLTTERAAKITYLAHNWNLMNRNRTSKTEKQSETSMVLDQEPVPMNNLQQPIDTESMILGTNIIDSDLELTASTHSSTTSESDIEVPYDDESNDSFVDTELDEEDQ